MAGLAVTTEDTSPSLAAIVAQVDPNLSQYRHQTSPDGMMTIVFTDIEGSTEMMERVGEQQWLEMMSAHTKLVRGVVARHGGEVVKSQGDGFMLVFRSVLSALTSAIELQHAMSRSDARDDRHALRVRIGVHTGNIFQLEDDFLGRAVVLAARITGRARGGEVLVSAASKEYTERVRRWDYGPSTSLSLKGLAGAERVYSLDWRAAQVMPGSDPGATSQ
jgi:class 3 adenylate cyclase